MGRILFDLAVCQPNGSGKYHGGGVYGIIVFKALAELYHSYISVYLDVNKFISEEALNIIKKYNNPLAELNKRIFKSANRFVVNVVYILKDCKCTYFPEYSGKQSYCIFSIISHSHELIA